MPKYIVTVIETTTTQIEIDAETEQAAQALAEQAYEVQSNEN